MNKKLIGLLLLGMPLWANAGDIAAGKAKSAVCTMCHGADGIGTAPIYPNLKGQKEAYLNASLKAYKASQRKGGMAALMNAQAAALSDEDIANLAAYYSSL
ncbi:c-type cytochrome [Psychromonas sp. RZ22]|uniref:c-type cytochrome n=1 Tax=Psychromonas algarum TaxID=2555643 RepID=UPI0010672DA6|nr:c-type cytochrome [Psychromonas sp. RZ22]TEW53375.1 c-type cytochrome [Psychromonas sp. RZ22]